MSLIQKSLQNFAMENVRIELQTRLISLLQTAAKSNRVLDLQEILERFAFDKICKLAFNVDPACLGGYGRFRFQMLLEEGKCPQHLLSLTLRMRGGLPVRVKER